MIRHSSYARNSIDKLATDISNKLMKTIPNKYDLTEEDKLMVVRATDNILSAEFDDLCRIEMFLLACRKVKRKLHKFRGKKYLYDSFVAKYRGIAELSIKEYEDCKHLL